MSAGRTLVISPNWIGDAVMAQPLVAMLKRQHPGRPIDVLAPPAVAPVWKAVAEVEEVLETPFRHGPLQLRERWKYARLLGQRGYVDSYVLPNTIKYALIPWLAGIPKRVGYKGESRYGLINHMHHDTDPPMRMVDFYGSLAASIGPIPRPAMQVDQAVVDAARTRHGLTPERPYIVFAPGAEFGPAKRWPASQFAALAKLVLAHDPAVRVVMLGSPKDHAAGEEVRAFMRGEPVYNLAGATSLGEAIALISQAAAVVSNDSGLLHIASAFNRPVVALYGPTDPDHAPPFSDKARSMYLKLDCAPCKQRECPLGHHHCMEQMSAASVWLALQPMLRN